MKKEETKLEKVSRYCKYCKDKYWNHSDCDSIRANGACAFCFREDKVKEE